MLWMTHGILFHFRSEWCGGFFAATQSTDTEWPEGVKVWAGRLTRVGRVMVPEALVNNNLGRRIFWVNLDAFLLS